MTVALAVIAALTVVNPPRVLSALPPARRVAVAAVAVVASWVVLVALAAAGDAVIDAVNSSAATLRIGTGLVVAAWGAFALGSPPPGPEPALPGLGAAAVPMAFPVLLSPAIGLLALSIGVDHSLGTAAAVLFAGLILLVPLAYVRLDQADTVTARVVRGLGGVLAAVSIAAGLALIMDGVFDI